MKFDYKAHILFVLIIVLNLSFNVIGNAEINIQLISLKTPPNGMDVRQILKEIKKQAGEQLQIGRFKELTIEIEINKLPLNKALEKIVAKYNFTAKKLQYKNTEILYFFFKDENFYIVDQVKYVIAH